MFDLSKNNASLINEAGYEFEIRTPTGESTSAFIKVRGEQSPVVRQYAKKKYNEYTMKEQAAKRRGKEVTFDLDEVDEINIEAAVLRTISWRGIAEEGKEIPFTKENAERIYKEHEWIRDQVLGESRQVENFRFVGI